MFHGTHMARYPPTAVASQAARQIHLRLTQLQVRVRTLIHLMAVMRVNSSWLEAFSTRMDASATQSTVGVACREDSMADCGS